MFCGAFTTRMKPKLTTNCSNIVMPMMLMPGVATPLSTAITIGIMADASAVALAKPRWMTTRNRLITARMNSTVASFRPNWATTILASQVAALVCSKAVPRLMPTPNRMTVPHGIRDCASFQVKMPKPGMNISATAVMVVVLVSNLWRMPSVTQKAIRVSDSASNFHSAALVGPSAASDLRMPSRPPGTCATSGGIMMVMTK